MVVTFDSRLYLVAPSLLLLLLLLCRDYSFDRLNSSSIAGRWALSVERNKSVSKRSEEVK